MSELSSYHRIAKYCETFETNGKASMEIFINFAHPTLPHNQTGGVEEGGVDLDVVYVLYFVCVVFLCCAFVITLLIFSSVRQC